MAKNLFVLSGGAKHRVLNEGMIGYRVEHPVKGGDKVAISISGSVVKEAGMKNGDRVQPIWDGENGEMILEKSIYGFKIRKVSDNVYKILFTYKKNMGIPDIIKRVDVSPLMVVKGKIIFCLNNQ